MNSKRVVEKLNHNIKDVWELLSNAENPENWNVYLDTRVLEGEIREKNMYYPSRFAMIVEGLIEFKVTEISHSEMKIGFFMNASYALSLKSSIHCGSSLSLLISLTVSFDSPFLLRWTYISVESLKSYLE